ncbi:MAG: hypothetical protein EBR23_12630 [Planctomycetia bacterium]|nr:hypothetical protein [Planctomycetia bacterium]
MAAAWSRRCRRSGQSLGRGAGESRSLATAFGGVTRSSVAGRTAERLHSTCFRGPAVETDFVAWLLPRLPASTRLEVPPGDDAAVLRPPASRRTVVTVDMLMEGIDFVLGPGVSARAIGHKALAVSLSDLAAMGSRFPFTPPSTSATVSHSTSLA